MKEASLYGKVGGGGGVNVYKRLCILVSYILPRWCWFRMGLWHILECGGRHAMAISQLPTVLHEPGSLTTVGIRWVSLRFHLPGSFVEKAEIPTGRNTTAGIGCALDTNLYMVHSIEAGADNV